MTTLRKRKKHVMKRRDTKRRKTMRSKTKGRKTKGSNTKGRKTMRSKTKRRKTMRSKNMRSKTKRRKTKRGGGDDVKAIMETLKDNVEGETDESEIMSRLQTNYDVVYKQVNDNIERINQIPDEQQNAIQKMAKLEVMRLAAVAKKEQLDESSVKKFEFKEKTGVLNSIERELTMLTNKLSGLNNKLENPDIIKQDLDDESITDEVLQKKVETEIEQLNYKKRELDDKMLELNKKKETTVNEVTKAELEAKKADQILKYAENIVMLIETAGKEAEEVVKEED